MNKKAVVPTSRRQIRWPKSEPLPKTVADAFRLGWECDGSSSEENLSQASSKGYFEFAKRGADLDLYFELPFKAKFVLGRPKRFRAVQTFSEPAPPDPTVASSAATTIET
jgi:hypothetical protein